MIPNRQKRLFYVSIVSVFLLLAVMTTSGCEPLRKKFTRQKKKDQGGSSKFIPVLDPIDYPDKVVTPQESYRHYFSLWQAWDKELVMRIEEHASNKKIDFTVHQALAQLTEMEKLLTGEKQKQLGQYIAQLREAQKDLAQPIAI